MPLDFPSSPTNGQTYENFVYDSSITAWRNQGSPSGLAGQVVALGNRTTSLEAYDASIEAGWTAYTPTFYNATIGNGTVSFYYKKIGKTVFIKGRFSLGSTSNIGTLLDWSLPFTVASNTLGLPTWGLATYYNGAIFMGSNVYIGGNIVMRSIRFIVNGSNISNGEVTPTNPFTWSAGCHFDTEFSYECL